MNEKKASLATSVLATKSMNLGSCLNKASSSTQQSIVHAWDRAKIWDINNPNAKRIHSAVAKMIAIDMEPFQV